MLIVLQSVNTSKYKVSHKVSNFHKYFVIIKSCQLNCVVCLRESRNSESFIVLYLIYFYCYIIRFTSHFIPCAVTNNTIRYDVSV